MSYVDSALQRILDFGSGTAIPLDDAQSAIGAAEIVARLKGHWGEEDPYSEVADKWVRTHPIAPPPTLVAKSVAALERILAVPSDLLEEWGEVDEGGAWSASVAELKQRVQS